ncbi:hypothetical protein BDZ94DRAFT_1248363 [Collybia nuda]|uniref:Fe2OG dioxygenase domain-containing protein n=1 Tax=Collybia nuda TaxID=64659 RepID=A0A9P5YES2_9AGAR|nr:hypothetical protein BDZ94DRAFT_1248363 [Collybia nuda]
MFNQRPEDDHTWTIVDYHKQKSSSQLPLAFEGRTTRHGTTPRQKAPERAPILGVGDALGTGDSYLTAGILPKELASVAFEKVKEEVKWDTMYHRGGEVPRLVAVEGEVGADGSFPVYRHPADESPPLSAFSSTVALIRDHVQKALNHPVNHVLIQYYRTGKDYISEHSDKTIDVVRGSNIVNVSLGAQRVMTLRIKKDRGATAPATENEHQLSPFRPSQRIPLPHNSMFVLGPETNAKWLHGINHDKRPLQMKADEEQYQGGERISLTFRHIGTFLSPDEVWIWGQGATGKTKETARKVSHGSEVGALIRAFGEENQRSDFDWDMNYGGGFDVLHFPQKE